MSLFNEYKFKKRVDRYNGNRHAIKFNCRDQFRVMSFAHFTDRAGFKDIETTLNLCGDLYRSWIKLMPRSTRLRRPMRRRIGVSIKTLRWPW